MIRTITGFHTDEAGDWVAELSCLHNQHVRHQPPFFDRPWTQTEHGRASRLGTEIDCPLCDRTEMPDDLQLVRTAGPFDDDTLPPGLRRAHRVGNATWGLLRIIEGALQFSIETDPPMTRAMVAGDSQAIPPLVEHELTFDGPFVMAVDFYTRK